MWEDVNTFSHYINEGFSTSKFRHFLEFVAFKVHNAETNLLNWGKRPAKMPITASLLISPHLFCKVKSKDIQVHHNKLECRGKVHLFQ